MDKVSGDEMVSDGYRVVDVDDIVYEVDGAMITVQDGDAVSYTHLTLPTTPYV